MRETASCIIRWNDTKETEKVIVSLDGHDNDQIFFVCKNTSEFNELLENKGEDFEILEHSIN